MAGTFLVVALFAVFTSQSAWPADIIVTAAGSGTAAYWGDGGSATTTGLDAPQSVGRDASGDLFVADTASNRIRMVPVSNGTFFDQVMTSDTTYTIAGDGTACSSHSPAGCGWTSGASAAPATSAMLDLPEDVETDSSGNVYISDTGDNMIAMVAASSCSSACPFGLASTAVGDIYDVAGTGTTCATHTPAGCLWNGPAKSAELDAPSGIAFDRSGDLLIADTTDNMVAMVAAASCATACPFGLASTKAGYIYDVAGTGTACATHTPAGCLWNGPAPSAKLDAPGDVTVDSAGNLYIVDTDDNMAAMVAAASCAAACPFALAATTKGDIYDLAGTGTACAAHTPGGCKWNRPATKAKLDAPEGVALDPSGNLIIGDTTDQMVGLVAGSACASACPYGLASTKAGDIYDVAGTGTAGATGIPGVAQSAQLDNPMRMMLDGTGDLLLADTTAERIVLVASASCTVSCPFGLSSTTKGDIYTVAGTGTAGFTGDGGRAPSTALNGPSGVATDAAGDVFIADSTNERVRMIPASSGTFFGQSMTEGDIYTVAGSGTACAAHTPAGCGYTSGGSAVLATSAELDAPNGVAVDSAGNLYVADTTDNMVAMVAASSCSSSCPFGLASTKAGYIYDIAGTGAACTTHSAAGCVYTTGGAASAATSARLDGPDGVEVDASGNVLIADTTNDVVAMVAASTCSSGCPYGLSSTTKADIYPVAGSFAACTVHNQSGCGYGGVATSAKLDLPEGVAVDSSGNLYVADTADDVVGMMAGSSCTSSCPLGLASTTRGTIYQVAGDWTSGATTSGSSATATNLASPEGVSLDTSGNLYIADTGDDMVTLVSATNCASACRFGLSGISLGDIYALAGTGTACASATAACGDTGAATSATLNVPSGVSVNSNGTILLVADRTDERVREILSAPGLLSISSQLSFTGVLTGFDLHLTSVLELDIIPSTYSVSGSPWSLAITSTTFNSGSSTLPTTATAVATPIDSCDSWFSVCVQAAARTGDPAGYPFTIPAGAPAPPSATFFSDETGTGQQTLNFPFLLTVPASSLKGTYTSQWTISIQNGP